jgi:hypothetical protein
MKRFLSAAALVALVASVGTAEEKPTAPMPSPAAPVVVTTAGTPVAEYAPAQTQRRGLFGRLRSRNTTMTYSPATPVMTAPIPAGATPMPPITAPQTMPGTKTSPTATTGQIVQATGNLPVGTYTTTDGTIIQIGGTQMATDSSMSSQSTRRGLFSRLRNR